MGFCKGALAISALAVSVVLAFNSSASQAEAIHPVLDDKFSFKLGGIDNTIDGTITVARAPLPVTPVDIEKILGIDDNQSSPWAHFKWRFRDRWALNFQFDRFDQSGGGVVTEPFNLDGQVYLAGVTLETEFRADAYILDVSYNIWQADNYEAGMGLGLHAFDIEVAVKSTFFVEDEDEVDLFDPTSESLIAPVPNIRFFATYAFSEKVSTSLNAGWLSLTYEDYDGSFSYVRGHVEYRFTEHWGVGIGGQYTDVDIEHDSGGGDFEELDVNFTGALLYFTYSF